MIFVDEFEKTIAEYAGSKYAVATDTGTAALYLICKFLKLLKRDVVVEVPRRTFVGVPLAIIQAGFNVNLVNFSWRGVYNLYPLEITDAACRFQKDMFNGNFMFLSFQYRKHIPIGRGGMVLTDDPYAADWIKKARSFGRPEGSLQPEFAGYLNSYMEPERAARGLSLFHGIKDKQLPDLQFEYPDLSLMKVFND